jgi:hypothetical protein
MLRPEPADRIELPDILMHPWLSGGARLPATLPVSVLQAAPAEAAAFVAPELPPGAVQGNVLMDPASPGTLRLLSIRFVCIAVIVAGCAWSSNASGSKRAARSRPQLSLRKRVCCCLPLQLE